MRISATPHLPPTDEPTTPEPRPPDVERAQNELLRAGYSLPRYGADGQLGSETASALRRFQQAHGLPSTGRLDAGTLAALETARSPSPDYAALFADGVLDVTLAVGFDEGGAHQPELADVLAGLLARGYRLGADQRFTRKVGDAELRLELITPSTPDAKARFTRAMEQSELVLYGGHGRYGSGPDFDDLASPAGNFVLGEPYTSGHVTLGPNDLERTTLPSHYQLMVFDGCSTWRYFDDLRARTPGKSAANLDLIGTNTELYWNVTAANLLTVLDGVTARKDLGGLTDALDAASDPSRSRHLFRGDGFEDN